MALPTLAQGQYSIGTVGAVDDPATVVYGLGASNIQITSTDTDTGTPGAQDQAVAGHDGQLFGVDTLPGMVITQAGFAYTSPGQGAAAFDAYAVLAAKWNDPAARLSMGTVQVLRATYRTSLVTRRCYGRGRKIMPSHGQSYQGIVPFTAQFQAADNVWYSDTEYSLQLTQVPSFSGTFTPPVTPPYQLSAAINYQQNVVVSASVLPTWPVITFTGPVTNPGLLYVNTPVRVGWTGTLGPTDSLVIDTRPWARTALLNGRTSVAGALTGNAMISLQIQPGSTVTRFTGQDYTGTSTCVIRWRNATLAIGGSV